jgi:hypothetical protein
MAAMAARPAEPGPTSRRSFLAGGAALVGLALAGCSDDGGGGADAGDADRASGEGTGAGAGTGSSGTAPATATALTAADFSGLPPCRLAPEQTEGPFYADLGLVRQDITEGVPGHPCTRAGTRAGRSTSMPRSTGAGGRCSPPSSTSPRT